MNTRSLRTTLALASALAATAAPSWAGNGTQMGTYHVSFTNPGPIDQPGSLTFLFNGTTPASVVGSNLTYSNDGWQVDVLSLLLNPQIQGDASFDAASSSVTLRDDQGIAGFAVPFTSMGSTGAFDLTYFDDPGVNSFQFDVNGVQQLGLNFAPDGTATAAFVGAGTNVVGTNGTPNPLTPAATGPSAAVPEPSSLLLLLPTLPLAGVIARRRRASA